ncbi:MAG: hypothetical protein FWF02_02340 [Micrococcales bacterium]|nr:hypothetical protein [Micrococcales bacterium]MCL2666530.1 hypothetical protein [Micrococcales bacterium]
MFYVLTATFLLLHEIESGYVKEWEILRLPGEITGFLLMHIPILFALFYGFYGIVEHPGARTPIGVAIGLGGLLPWLVHKVVVNKREYFSSAVSNVIIYGSAVSGLVLVVLAVV